MRKLNLNKIFVFILLLVFSTVTINVYAVPQTNTTNTDTTNTDTNKTDTNKTDNNKDEESKTEVKPKPAPVYHRCQFTTTKLEGLYGPSLEYDVKSKSFLLKINIARKNDSGDYPTFKITKIAGRTDLSGVGLTTRYGSPATLNRNVILNAASADDSIVITLSTSDAGNCEGSKREINLSCGSGSSVVDEKNCSKSITITVDADVGGDQLEYDAKITPIARGNTSLAQKINCDASKLANYRDEGDTLDGSKSYTLFQKRYCMAKIMAEKQGHSYTTMSDVTARKTLKCAQFVVDVNDVATQGGVKILTDQELKDGYRNATYYEASFEKELIMDEYKYEHRLDPNSPITYEDPPKCTINCTETVKVLYEPPVASKAGFCFEYKVKVESMVSCSVTNEPDPPNPNNYKYCYPSPACHHYRPDGSDDVMISAGPTDDFDECIKKCDGGKYTKSCSRSCYNKVYKDYIKSGYSKLSYSDSPTVVRLLSEAATARLEECKKKSTNGCYYRDSVADEVFFSPNSIGKVHGVKQWMAGTYYIKRGAGPKHAKWNYKDFVVSRNDGFFRKVFKGGSICGADCHWIEGKCEGKYLNEESGYAESDYEKNVQKYEQALDKCNAGATCSSNTVIYTMSADYTDDKGVKHTVRYPDGTVDTPDSKNNDSITISENTSSCPLQSSKQCSKVNGNVTTEEGKFNTQGITCPEAYPSTLKDFGGCYVCSNANNYYMGEIRFPGTWVENKTGNISFTKQGDGWRKEKNKFCVPLNTQDTNKLWYLWYLKKEYSTEYTYIKEFKDYCLNIDTTDINTLKQNANKETRNYNLHATVTNFGYYGWNFNLDCFYGLNTKYPPTTTITKEVIPPCDTDPNNYFARTVNLENVFPDREKGDILVNNEAGTNTGRTPGFNWTSYALIYYSKDRYMAIDPMMYLGAVQKRGQDIYKEENEDDYLDYEFYLTPSVLMDIRKIKGNYDQPASPTSDGSNVSKSSGYNFTSCGRSVYTSALINYLETKHAVKKRIDTNGTTRCCNNPKGNGECEYFGVDKNK